MLDYSLLDNFRDFFKFMFDIDCDIGCEKDDYFIRYGSWDIREELLQFIMG